MTNRAAAIRYSRALLETSQKEGDAERVEKELSDFVALMDSHASLRASLVSPAVPSTVKKELIEALLARAGSLSGIFIRLLTMLTECDRLGLVAEILDQYRAQLMKSRGIVRARITTAALLPHEKTKEIVSELERVTGKQVMLKAGVDSSIIGGVITQIGSTVFDGSVARHLERLKQQFLSEA
jgi:F-type H+-transporting ATPase subunit delta